jgi:hypothetical protein
VLDFFICIIEKYFLLDSILRRITGVKYKFLAECLASNKYHIITAAYAVSTLNRLGKKRKDMMF